ncbi:hypothetical protein H0H81_006511 [Sphagnurus paluster]|uniref:GDP/GTP exchange factor Sec2 N-terminal domain-containing protein n=1 Tax=Sphagnurus paluster TaxID=117069 RepID=A0A9P7FTP9_9AGAR|nr:hypothetical protein H0H81_006511 [Sphagnurus paluster]
MIHFPSSLQNGTAPPGRSDSLNATQQKSSSHKIFLTIEEELHDARRVHSHGQEEDLRLALNMLTERLSQLAPTRNQSTMLSDAYKTNAELEVQLNVTKSNLQLVISNNEMLEDALKRESSGHAAQNVGWRRGASGGSRTQSTDDTHQPLPELDSPVQESSRFFKFRFTNSNSTSSASSSRPSTPHDSRSPAIPAHHLNSPSLPVLPVNLSKDKEQLEELERELEKEKKARKAIKAEKQALEEEIESLSQALFEEANKMVATERIRRADIEEELKQTRLEKEALRSALRLLEGENETLRSNSGSECGSPAVPHPESPSSSPRPQHLPASLSTINGRLPPPAPLGVPTTPFDYDASFAVPDTADTATPRRPPQKLEGEADGEKPNSDAVEAGEDVSVTQQLSNGIEETTEATKPQEGVQGQDEIHGEESVNESEADEVQYAHRPPSLELLPQDHDPWAGAPSSSRIGPVFGNAV